MERLINVFIEERNKEKNEKGGLIDGLNLKIKDPRINNIYKNVSNALISVDNATKEKDDIIQELLLAVWEVTPVFLANMETSLEELLEAIKKENNELAAKYFTYLNIRAVGAVKDKYKVTNVDKEKSIEEVFFTDVIKGNYSEEQIADKLNIDSISYGSYSNFIAWLKENGHKFLTNKQIQYLQNDMINYTDKQNFDFRKNITKRVLKYLNMNEYSTSNIKKIELMNQVNILESINSKNFFQNLKSNLDIPIVNELIYSELFTFAELKEITSFYNDITATLPLNLIIKILLVIENKKYELLNRIEEIGIKC